MKTESQIRRALNTLHLVCEQAKREGEKQAVTFTRGQIAFAEWSLGEHSEGAEIVQDGLDAIAAVDPERN